MHRTLARGLNTKTQATYRLITLNVVRHRIVIAVVWERETVGLSNYRSGCERGMGE